MKYIISTIHILLFILVPITLLAIPESDIGGKVTGIIHDKQSNKPVEYATVTIYNSNDSSLVTGIVSSDKGVFSVEKLKTGNYYVVIQFMGYADKIINNIIVNNRSAKVDLGVIPLILDTKVLGNVEVVAQKRSIEYQIDKKVITVGEEMTSASMSAVEVLENVPSIRVDIEGNVSLRGSTGFTVLVDGKPTILEPSDVLQQTPASSIQNIEIITNPSVKYEPDGTGGIINIITKKNKRQGVQGLVNLNAGRFNQYGGDFLLNYRKKDINMFIGGEYGKYPYPGRNSSERHTLQNDTTTIISSTGERERIRTKSDWRAGFDWDITPKDNFSIEAHTGEFKWQSNTESNYLTTIEQANYNLKEISFNEFERSGRFYSATANYLHKFNRENHDLMIQVNYGYHGGDEFSRNFLKDDNQNINRGTKTTEKGPSGRWDIKLDYSKPFRAKDMLETGFQIRQGTSTDRTGLNTYDTISNNFVNQPEYGNEVEYVNDIYALYGMYRGYINNLGYQLGIRGEYTFRDINSIKSNENFNIDQIDYFPTLHLSWQFPEDNQVMVSYSRRIDRPRGWRLEPFITWSDMFNVRKGNPDLKNEYIDAYEMGYVKKWGDSQLSVESYYRLNHNKIERIQSVYDDGILLTSFENVGTDYSLGLEVMYTSSLYKWWDVSLLGDLFDYKIKGTKNEEPFEKESFNWSSRVSNTFRLSKTVRFQLDGDYNSPTVSSQGKMMDYWSVNCALRTDLLDRKLSATLQVRDVFATAERVYKIEDSGLYNYQMWKSDAPLISLSIIYRINNFTQKMKQSEDNNDITENGF